MGGFKKWYGDFLRGFLSREHCLVIWWLLSNYFSNLDVEGGEGDDECVNSNGLRCGSFFKLFLASPKCRFERKSVFFLGLFGVNKNASRSFCELCKWSCLPPKDEQLEAENDGKCFRWWHLFLSGAPPSLRFQPLVNLPGWKKTSQWPHGSVNPRSGET